MPLDKDVLAALMETCLAEVWQEEKGQVLPQTGKEDREILFKAIARAVVRHIKAAGEVVLSDPKHDHAHTITCSVDVEARTESNTLLTHDHRATCTVTIPDHKHPHAGRIK
jgi:hypothetical protein